jgi:PAS domain S-box-containing protein
MKRDATREELKKGPRGLQKEIQGWKSLSRSSSENENFYKSLLENSLAGHYVLQDGKFLAINSIAASYTGYDQEELIGKRADGIIFPEDKKEAKRNARDMLMGTRLFPCEFRIVTKQKQIRWIMETVTSILFEGKPAVLGNSMDITERKKVEQRLQESENLYRAIFETTGTAIIIIEEDKTISLINSEFEKLTGYRKEEWVGKKKWTEYVVKKDLNRMKRYHHLRRIDPGAAPRTYEHDLIDSQGRIRNVHLTVGMIPGTSKSVASFTDITAWKEAEKGLKKREEELEIKSRNLEELNTALRVLLKQREEDREELEGNMLSNIKEFVLPYVERMDHNRMSARDKAFAGILESNLKEILSPFSRKLSSRYLHLTPKEIQIANFVKEGRTSKEIAEILNVSKSAVDIHRYRLRNKLGLNNQKANLRSHLVTLS